MRRTCASYLSSSGLPLVLSCGRAEPSGDPPDVAALMDPSTCAGCHPVQYEQWASSMHAYAADDPLFLAMNRRGQAAGEIDTFCVECHAPMAVRSGALDRGIAVEDLPSELKGVTCYFCHSAVSVDGSHNAPIELADDGVMRGAFDDPQATTAHGSAYSELLDRDRLESAQLCGACHDIVNDRGAHLERTFLEWQESVYAAPDTGTTCGQCHMPRSLDPTPVAAVSGAPKRRIHDHLLPGVDRALTPFPGKDEQEAAVQALLDSTLQSALCVRGSDGNAQIQVVLDNVAAGHSFPSGSAQDRRAWVQVVAYQGDQIIYQSGVVPEQTAVTEHGDPDLWLIRDCMLDDSGRQVHMFWEAEEIDSNLLPAQKTFDPSDPDYYLSHVYRNYPKEGSLDVYPDRVTLDVWLRPFDLAVFDELAESGDLVEQDGTSIEEMRQGLSALRVGSQLVWTPDAVTESFVERLFPVECVSASNLKANVDKVRAPERSRCSP